MKNSIPPYQCAECGKEGVTLYFENHDWYCEKHAEYTEEDLTEKDK